MTSKEGSATIEVAMEMREETGVLPVDQETFEFRKQFWKLAGGAFRIYDSSDSLLFFSKQKAFKLREDIRIYVDEKQSREALRIETRQILDVAATYDVIDSALGQKIGSLKRKGLKSVLRDQWEILDPQGLVIGKIEEDSLALALFRRFVTNLIPQRYSFFLGTRKVGEFRQHFRLFVYHATLHLERDGSREFNRSLAVAAGILLMAIEGRQQ